MASGASLASDGTLKMIDSIFFGVSNAGIILWICLMVLWTVVQVMLNLVPADEE